MLEPGFGQLIPCYRHYAVDFDNDGVRDIGKIVDAIGSVANYFKRHGWQGDAAVAVPVQVQHETPELLKLANDL